MLKATKLDDIIRETGFMSVSHLIEFINELDIPEARPLQKFFTEAANEEAVFPQGLTKEKFEHKLQFVYFCEPNEMYTLDIRMTGNQPTDYESSLDRVYEVYVKDFKTFEKWLKYSLDNPLPTIIHKSKPVEIPTELPDIMDLMPPDIMEE